MTQKFVLLLNQQSSYNVATVVMEMGVTTDPCGLKTLIVGLDQKGTAQMSPNTADNVLDQLATGTAFTSIRKYVTKGSYRKTVKKVLPQLRTHEGRCKQNTERHPQSPIDDAFVWKNWLDKGVYLHSRDIAEANGVSESTVSKTITLLKASPELINFERKYPTLGLSVLYELYQLELVTDSKMALEMARKFVKRRVKRDQIAHLRKEIAGKESKKLCLTSPRRAIGIRNALSQLEIEWNWKFELPVKTSGSRWIWINKSVASYQCGHGKPLVFSQVLRCHKCCKQQKKSTGRY